MKFQIKALGAFTLLFLAQGVLAQVDVFGKTSLSARGTGGGNGGGSVKCGNVIEMADIHEGRLRHRQSYEVPTKSPSEIVKDALDVYEKYDPTMARLVAREIRYFYQKLSLVHSSTLNYTEDYNYIVVEDGCEYIQLAIWDNLSGNVIVREDLYDRMDNLNKAALALHEGIYSARRIAFGDENSDYARMINAYLLSASSSKEDVLGSKFYQTEVRGKNSLGLLVNEGVHPRVDVFELELSLDKTEYFLLAKKQEELANQLFQEIVSRRDQETQKELKPLYLAWKDHNDARASYRTIYKDLECEIEIEKEARNYALESFEQSLELDQAATLNSSAQVSTLYGLGNELRVSCNKNAKKALIKIKNGKQLLAIPAQTNTYTINFIKGE